MEVTPPVFIVLREKQKLHIGWTLCALSENLYVRTCYECSTLAHSSRHCAAPGPVRDNSAGEHDTSACTLAEHAAYVRNECRRWDSPTQSLFWCQYSYVRLGMARLRARTHYIGRGWKMIEPPHNFAFVSSLSKMSREVLKYRQANQDHRRTTTSHVIDFVQNQGINFVIIGDPYLHSGKMPGLHSLDDAVCSSDGP